MFELEGDWRGVFGSVSVVKDTRGEVVDDVLGAGFRLIAEFWLKLDEVEIEFMEQVADWL